jgi:uncharacterized protein (DUF885 family)
VNEWDPEYPLLSNLEAIAYHEGVPGHHLQISISQEIGFYQDPYSNYGRLENEMWWCIRLAVDTGVHAKHWSRDEMVEYFHRYTAMDERNIQSEVHRYIAWPGQAQAHKLGQMEILKLGEEAKQELGAKSICSRFMMKS